MRTSTSRSAVRRGVSAAACSAAAVALVGGLAACSGQNPRLTVDYQPADGVATRVGDIRVLNAVVVVPASSEDAGGGSVGQLVLTVSNRADAEDVIAAVSSDAGEVQLTGDRTVPARGVLQLGAESDPAATLTAARDLVPGRTVRVTVDFEQAGEVRLQVPVLTADGYYASYAPRTESGSPSPDGSATGATPSPSG